MDPGPALSRYAELVRLWSPRLDLVSTKDLDRFEERHLADCLRACALTDAAPEGAAVDVGSGAGLPGIPLAIAGRPRPWRLLEPRRRRAGFLEEVVRELRLDCEVVVATAQQAAADPGLRRSHAVATARALAAPEEAFGLLAPLVFRGGSCLVWAGRGARIPPNAEEPAPGILTIRAWEPGQEITGRNPPPA